MNEFERMRRNAEAAKRLFSPGTRIRLLHMDDPYHPIPDGMRGTVQSVDDAGTIFLLWDNNRTLGVVYGEDAFRKLTIGGACRGTAADTGSGHEAVIPFA
mgnify:CR=1 FL=1